ncbi:hypothetical protein ACVME5_007831 [Bradyrhizobium liaoningense]
MVQAAVEAIDRAIADEREIEVRTRVNYGMTPRHFFAGAAAFESQARDVVGHRRPASGSPTNLMGC